MWISRAFSVGLVIAAVTPALAQQTQLKVATLAPEGSTWMVEARRAAEAISERTDGRVSFRFYPGGTMGSDDSVLRKMRIGQLHGGAILAGSLTEIEPNVELYNLPLLFNDYDEVDAVRAEFDSELTDRLKRAGMVSFGFLETGFVYLMSTRAVSTFADLGERKIWMPEGDSISKAIAEASGLSPVPLAVSDVMTGLQTGLVDTVAAPPVGAVALQWFTKAKYVTDLPMTYLYGTLVISDTAMGRLKPDDRAVVMELLTQAIESIDDRARSDTRDAREALIRQGVTFIPPSEELRQRWDAMAAEATESLLREQGYDAGLVARIQRVLADHRSERAAGGAGS
jgi:TRAP-type C4-dicarboxylate transport system substrate-binding protein